MLVINKKKNLFVPFFFKKNKLLWKKYINFRAFFLEQSYLHAKGRANGKYCLMIIFFPAFVKQKKIYSYFYTGLTSALGIRFIDF